MAAALGVEALILVTDLLTTGSLLAFLFYSCRFELLDDVISSKFKSYVENPSLLWWNFVKGEKNRYIHNGKLCMKI